MYTTRYGRLVKKPEVYVPVEEVEDDYSDHEDIPDSEVSSNISYDSDEDEDEVDSEGSLKDFVVDEDDDEEEEEESSDEDTVDES